MTALLDLCEKLQDTNATIDGLRKALAGHPNDAALALTFRSLETRYRDLEQAFLVEANADHLDVCNYRIMPEGGGCSVAAITRVLGSFQELVTVAFDAIKTGPKIRARLSAEVVAGSSFDFGYTYPGSLGFMLTMPNERLLIGESELDRAVRSVFEMTKVETPQQLARYVTEFGVASIRRLYAWSSAHIEHGLSADIKWQRQTDERASVTIQKEELAQLCEIIDKASEEKVETYEIIVELTGLDVGVGNWFRLSRPEAADITGKISASFSRAQAYEIHGKYYANLLKKSKIHYSIDREEERWELIELKKLATY